MKIRNTSVTIINFIMSPNVFSPIFQFFLVSFVSQGFGKYM